MAYPWDDVRVSPDGRSLAVSLSGCLRPFDVNTASTPQRITVTVHMMISASAASCPASVDTRRVELSEPVGSRVIVDGSFDPTASMAVAWTKATAVLDGATLRIGFPDRSCSHIARTTVVETPATVTVTVFEATTRAGVPCPPPGELVVHDLPLAAPLAQRPVLDGRAAYITPTHTP
jgi:hypothetical protein